MTSRIGIVLHHHRPEVVDLALRAVAWCATNDVSPSLPEHDASLVGRPDLAAEPFGADVDVLLSLGGDGTMLRAVPVAARNDVPILGVNAGHLGYLTEVDPSQLEGALDAWRSGGMTEQERMLLEVRIGDDAHYALNEVVVERAESGHSVAVDAAIDGNHFTRYLADGIIVATPTGSTAYSLSAGGPIVEPDFEALVLTPVAPHMVFDRSLILKPSTTVELTVTGYRDGVVTLDGRQIARLAIGRPLVCRAAPHRARFLRLNGRSFHDVLKEKFGLEDR